MILPLYSIIGFGILAMILLSKTHKAMNLLSAIHPLAYLVLAAYTLSYSVLPAYYLADEYFFIDHLGLYEVIIASVLFFFAAVYSKGYVEGSMKLKELSPENLKLYYVAFNLLLIAITHSFFSNNLALFWIFAELTTVFSAVLVVTLNAKKNIGAALKYIFIASSCMLFAFVGLIFLFASTEHILGEGTLNWNLLMEYASQLPPAILFASFAFIFVGFAAKSGVVPFHAWLPTAHSKAPAPISVILSGSVTSVGIYGIIRVYAIVAQTPALPKASMLLLAAGLFSMAVAALTMLSQSNLKKLIGYSTIEHTGFMLVGLGIGTPVAIFWVLFHKLAHALTKALLFFSAGILHHQYEGVRIEQIKNALKLQPFASAGIIIGSASIIGMPLFAVFLSKLFILIQAAEMSFAVLVGLLTAFLIAAGALGIFLMRMLAQGIEEDTKNIAVYSPTLGMKLPIIVLIVAIIVLGLFFPQQLADLLNNIIEELGMAR